MLQLLEVVLPYCVFDILYSEPVVKLTTAPVVKSHLCLEVYVVAENILLSVS